MRRGPLPPKGWALLIDGTSPTAAKKSPAKVTKSDDDQDDVLFKEWCIVLVGGFLSFKDLCRWDMAMCSQREKFLSALSNIKIAGIDQYPHDRNESIRWMISRHIQHVTKITFGDKPKREITGRMFSGAAKRLPNLKSMELKNCIRDGILTSLNVNCPNLEELKLECKSIGKSTTFAAAAHMVQKLSHLRKFTFTRNEFDLKDVVQVLPMEQSSSSLLLALAQYCPLLESLNLAKYEDEGMAELVAGCPKLHTLIIEADTHECGIAGYRTLGQSRSITTLHINTYLCIDVEAALNAMADEGMPIRFLELYTNDRYKDTSFHGGVSSVARFAPTLEHLKLRDFSDVTDEHLEVLSQCHNLRSIEIVNAEAEYQGDFRYGSVTGSFLIPMSIGCPLLEIVFVNEVVPDEVIHHYNAPDVAVNFEPFFERCPKLKSINLDIRTDDVIKALTQHCPLVESLKLGSSCGVIPQEYSEISDDSLEAIAQNLHFLTHIWLNHTQCTDTGLLALAAKGKCSMLKEIYIHNGPWGFGYPELISMGGIKKFDAIMKECTNNYVGFNRIFYK